MAHVVHSATGVVTHAAQVVAGAAAHAFDAVNNTISRVAQLALRAAAHVAHTVISAATRVVHTVSDAVSRTVGVVANAASATWHWVQKHNLVFGKIGSVLSTISGGLALAGLVIAPIPGLDALTPVLEGAAVATSLGALAAQGIAKAAGDSQISYGDLLGDALGAIPGLGAASHDAQDAVEATDLAKLADTTTTGEASAGLSRARNFKFGNLPAGELGSTDKFGNITIQRGLTGKVFDETLRHETVHSVLTPPAPLNEVSTFLYAKSGLYRYAEEALAEGYGTRSVAKGLAYPLTNGYVSPLRLGLELGAGTAVTGGAAYGVYEATR